MRRAKSQPPSAPQARRVADVASETLAAWSSFYVMTGSAAAALTGLMFIVITLVTSIERMRRNPDGISTYSTPTVVHFSAAFLVSGVLCAPWRAFAPPAAILGLAALAGIAYIARTTVRSRGLQSYSPDFEDWASYSVLPFLAYGAILIGAVVLASAARSIAADALFAIAGGVTLLILLGIHNAWDVVTYIAMGGPPE